jgi:hypothetical protein
MERINAMKANKVLPLSLAGSLVITTWAAHCREPLHTEQYQNLPQLTVQTATIVATNTSSSTSTFRLPPRNFE